MIIRIDYGNSVYHGVLLDTDDSAMDRFTDEEDKATALFCYIVNYALENPRYNDSTPFDTIKVEEVYGSRQAGDYAVPTGNLMEVCRNLTQLAELDEDDLDVALAMIVVKGWQNFDLDDKYWKDDLRYVVDRYDFEGLSKEYMENMGDTIAPGYARWFDHEAHGKYVANDMYSCVTFNGMMYVVGE